MKKLLLILIATFAFSLNALAAVNINTATQAELDWPCQSTSHY